jgi:hypothetical protein
MPIHSLGTVTIFAEFAGQFCAAFVEDARQKNITAQPHARAARRALCQVSY